MGDIQKWRVTYTKHVKQKRKVYQDGSLELHCSNGTDKILLYDDCEKLLDSRFLKKGDLVGCGETLTFDGYLVDVGDLDKNCTNSVSDSSNAQRRAPENFPSVRYNIKKENEKCGQGNNAAPVNPPSMKHALADSSNTQGGVLERRKRGLGHNVAPGNHQSVRYNIKKEDEKCGLGNNAAPVNRPSMKKSIKRENNATGPENCGEPVNHSSARDNMSREWRALYTAQKTQKAKKYHDGILRLVVGVFDRKQVLLYDDTGKQLDSRYLKMDEVVGSGETLIFDAYLVDIGDLEENCKPLPDSSIQGRTKKPIDSVGQLDGSGKSDAGKSVAPENYASVTQNVRKEWHALYTTQKTQKAKKYHDGILRLLVGISHRKQVILLSEDETLLSSKYLSSTEDVRTGCRLELANYLVEVGEARNSQEGEAQDGNSSGAGVTSCSSISNVGGMKLHCSGTRDKSTTYGLWNNTNSGKDLGAYSSSSEVEKVQFSQTGVRNVHQILSTLTRPIVESNCPAKEPVMQHTDSSRLDLKLSGRNSINNIEESPEIYLEKSKTVANPQEVMHRSDNGGELQLPIPSSSNISLGVTESNSLVSEIGVVYPEKPKMKGASTIAGQCVSDVISDLPEDTQILNQLEPHDAVDGAVPIKGCNLYTGQEALCGDGHHMANDVPVENSNQPCADITFTDSKRRGVEQEKYNLKEKTQVDTNDEFPSFDLGF